MTGKRSTKSAPYPANEARWALQDAKARFSEVVRRAREQGPQHVTVHGREEVVVISETEFRRLRASGRTGADLVAAMRKFPEPDIDLEPERFPMPVRDVEF
jgi:prevent-host-death family protein